MKGTAEPTGGSSAVLTVPNLISATRIALIPVFVALIVDPDTTLAGVVLFGLVVATDWVDGTIARRTGQVSELGKILDPVADRLAIAAGLIALMVRDVFPVWAGLLILVRDAAVLVVGLVALRRFHTRLDVRFIGKVATFCLMVVDPRDRVGEPGHLAGRRRARRRVDLLRGGHRGVLPGRGHLRGRPATGDANARVKGSIVPPTAPRRTAGMKGRMTWSSPRTFGTRRSTSGRAPMARGSASASPTSRRMPSGTWSTSTCRRWAPR